MKFLHTMVRVADKDVSLKFYQEILGLKLSRTKDLSDRGAMLYFLTDETGCCEIELTYNFELPEGGYTHGDYFGHFAFEVENMDDFTKKLQEHNLEYFREPFNLTEKGPRIAFIKDPDGIIIELIQKKKD